MTQPAVVAHRGASAHLREHTMAAYELALDQGADAVECDVRLTRDGHLVCVHDRTVDRTSDGTGVVSEMTLPQLAELDFGDGAGVLVFDDLLALVRERGSRVFVETKHPVRYGGLVETKLIALLARHGLASPPDRRTSPVVVMSFSANAVRRTRRHAPALPTVLLLTKLWPAIRDGALPAWADIAGPGVSLLRADPGYVARAAARGHEVYTWTVNEPADIALCAELGVAHVATDAPARTRAALEPS